MISSVRTVAQLEDGLVLAPERYDPRRRSDVQGSMRLRDLVSVPSEIVSEKHLRITGFVVLNTGDANRGFVTVSAKSASSPTIGSAKKVLRAGDVVISRLRPYLQQVAYLDEAFWSDVPPGAVVVCSTEFYILRSLDSDSVAFLVPFLLSGPVQAILAAAQEGGHHPRFNLMTLLDLAVPNVAVERRAAVSASVIESVAKFRLALTMMDRLADKVLAEIGDGSGSLV